MTKIADMNTPIDTYAARLIHPKETSTSKKPSIDTRPEAFGQTLTNILENHKDRGERPSSIAPLLQQELSRLIAGLKVDNRTVVLISHGTEEQLQDDTASFDADLFVRGHTRNSKPELMQINKRPVVQVGSANYVAAIALQINPDGSIKDVDYRKSNKRHVS